MEKLFNRNFVLCVLMQFWFMIAFNMTLPLIAQYVVVLGESATMGGFVAGIFSFLALAMRPFSGFAADRISNKTLLFAGYIASIVAFVGYGLAPNVGVLLVFRVIHAFGLCLQTTVTSAAAMQFIPKSRVVEGIGYIGVAAQLGLALGPTIGVLFVDALGYRGTFFAAAILMLITIALLVPVPIAPPDRKDAAHSLSIKDFVYVSALPLTVTLLAFSVCCGLTSTLLVMMGNVRGIAGVTVFFIISSLGIASMRPYFGRRVDRRGLNSVIPITFICETICCVLLAFANSLALVIGASIGRIFGQGVAQSSLQGQVLKDAGPEARGVASSTAFLGIDVGQGLGAIVGGALIDAAGFEGTFIFGPVCLIAGLISYVYWFRKQRTDAARATD